MRFTVKLNKKSGKIVRVKYTTENGSATAGSDYVAQTGTVIFLPGTKTAKVNITIKGDRAAEVNETFSVILSNSVNATITDGTATGTILNDDGAAIASVKPTEQEMTVRLETIKLMPNPAQEKVNVMLTGYSGDVVIQLSDMHGRKLAEYKTVSMPKFTGQQIDLSKYAGGVYFITAIDEEGNRRTAKLIIAK
jgi:hypothetical protein